ncbi:hypothetical protein GOP47_0008499 [Adiantum capillus-veneris]|uniref:Uncharacterized protein n=1 Tax=Adiantum capillus-veneris TaxID=13818 RepID=A0A9D4ZI86_ADICA|nr:hypothetical protein GOP47_0008499 [Adiantum capillus-veneris]
MAIMIMVAVVCSSVILMEEAEASYSSRKVTPNEASTFVDGLPTWTDIHGLHHVGYAGGGGQEAHTASTSTSTGHGGASHAAGTARESPHD